MTTEDFLINLRRVISVYSSDAASKESNTLEDKRLDMLKLILAQTYYEIIEYYFSSGIIEDAIIEAEPSLAIAINKFNEITKSYIYL